MENITFGLLALANVLVPNAMAMTASDSVGTSATPVYSTIQVVAAATTTTNDTDADVSIVAPVESSISVGTTTGMSATELYVRTAFKSTPVLIQVARCESQFRQTDSDGNILHGTVDPRDVGVMQINEHYQGAEAAALGFDIDTLQGNVAYAKVLYAKEGTKPWTASEKCWSASDAGSDAN